MLNSIFDLTRGMFNQSMTRPGGKSMGKPYSLAVLGGETPQAVGSHHTMVARTTPSLPATDVTITWSSSNPAVMTISGNSGNGADATMVGVAPGTADAIATAVYHGQDTYDTTAHIARQTVTITA